MSCSSLFWLFCKTDLRILDVDSENHQGLARSISIKRRLCQDLNMVLISKTMPGLCRDGNPGVGNLLSEKGADGKPVE